MKLPPPSLVSNQRALTELSTTPTVFAPDWTSDGSALSVPVPAEPPASAASALVLITSGADGPTVGSVAPVVPVAALTAPCWQAQSWARGLM